MNPLAQQVVTALRHRGETLAFCESLTAGLAGATVATVPGASAVLRGGLVTYATDLKVSLAGVGQETVDKYGPVDEHTAREMADGTRARCASDWAVSLTGVAGPDEQNGHPVGEVFIGVAGPAETTVVRAYWPGRTRATIRATAVDAALTELLTRLGTNPSRSALE